MAAKLYYTVLPETVSDGDVTPWLSVMTQERRATAESYRFAKDRLARCAAYALLCRALREAGSACLRPLLSVDSNGKPYLMEGKDIRFNLSHSGRLVACALDEAEVGVDVQQHRAIDDALAKRVLSPAEYARWGQSDDPTAYFFAVWTLKESYIKYTGLGLATPLRRLSFDVGDGQAALHGHEELRFSRFALLDGYSAGLCSTRDESAAPAFVANDALLSFMRDTE